MLTVLVVFALLVLLWGAFKFGEANATVRFDVQGRKRLP